VINEDIKKMISDITYENTIILVIIEIVIIVFIAIYSSHKKIKYFLSIFLISIMGGNLAALLILVAFNIITYTNLENIRETVLEISRFGAIPSIVIAFGLLKRPIKNIED
jgi:hypothetical protein